MTAIKKAIRILPGVPGFDSVRYSVQYLAGSDESSKKQLFNYCIFNHSYYNKIMDRRRGMESYNGSGGYEGAFGERDDRGTLFETHEGEFGSDSGMPRELEHRLYSSLMTSGRYAELDKAKHNAQYRSYLLSNMDDDMPF